MSFALTITDGGLSTTLQDLGRPGYQRFGIPTSGALDAASLKLANRLVGNPDAEAALECSYLGPSFLVESETLRVAFVGAEATVRCQSTLASEDRLLPMQESVTLRHGDCVSVGTLRGASTLYMAVEGGFAVEPTLGSRSTFLRGGIGGFRGRRLQSGDCIPLRLNRASEQRERRLVGAVAAPANELRILPGPQVDHFSKETLNHLCEAVYTIGSGSDRTGMRLEGPSLSHLRDYNITSDAVVQGSIQVPGDGKPILLLADRQTTGGYPKIATVISADLSAAGRLPIGSAIRFRFVDAAQAEIARKEARRHLDALSASIILVDNHMSLADRLMMGNLVSGVVDAHV
jgi:biotin-dependent carboxylase-like uncharacterized protein